MDIEGRLSELSLPTLIQVTSGQGGQACLHLAAEGCSAFLYFEDGDVVHAVLEPGGHEGEQAVYQVLGWTDGDFDLQFGVPAPEHSIQIPCNMLLVDGLQLYDEQTWDRAEEGRLAVRAWTPEVLHALLVDLAEQAPGFVLAAVLNVDGEAEAEHTARPLKTQAVHPKLAQMFKLVDTLVGELERGVVEDYVLIARDSYLLLRLLRDRNFALGIVADRGQANLGGLRLEARRCAGLLDSAMFETA